MSDIDPPRLDSLEGASELSELLRSAQSTLPADDVVARLAANLGLPPPGGGGGGGGGGGSAAPPQTAPLAGSAPAVPAAAVSVKAIGIAALAGGAALTGWLTFGPAAEPPPAPLKPPPVAVVAPAPLPVPSPPVELPPTLTAPPATTASVPAVVARPRPAPSASARPETPEKVEEPASEVELVGQAQRALRSNPALALSLTSRHQKLYPGGALVQEREVLAIEALSALGQLEAARSRATAFEKLAPGSPYAVRVARAIKKAAPSGQ